MKTATLEHVHDEARQGEVFLINQEKQVFSKHFYIEFGRYCVSWILFH